MRKIFPCILLSVLFCISISAQTLSKPNTKPSEPTASQQAMIQEGSRLHDQKQYDEAIKKYEQVLQENPTCVMAIYEMTLSLYYKKDFKRALDSAYEGLKYESAEIPLFLGLIGNIYDDQGNPEKAVDLYERGIEILSGDKQYKPYLASIYYNLGVTNVRQKKLKDARENLKKAIPLDFQYASPNYLLSVVFMNGNYKVPAMLAASRLLSLELNSQRSQTAASIIKNVMQGGVSKGANPNDINITLDANAPKDEGDFEMINMMLGISKAGTDMVAGANAGEEAFAGQIESMIGYLEKENKLQSTFVGQNYIPYMVEMKRLGHVKPFAYIVLYHTGNKNAQAWLSSNNQKATDFLNWAKAYKISAQK